MSKAEEGGSPINEKNIDQILEIYWVISIFICRSNIVVYHTVKMLVREISMDGANVLEITHKPIAKLLVKQAVTLEQKSINQFLKDFLAKEKK